MSGIHPRLETFTSVFQFSFHISVTCFCIILRESVAHSSFSCYGDDNVNVLFSSSVALTCMRLLNNSNTCRRSGVSRDAMLCILSLRRLLRSSPSLTVDVKQPQKKITEKASTSALGRKNSRCSRSQVCSSM